MNRLQAPGIPHVTALDSSLGLLRDGYLFVSRRCAAVDSDVFATHLMLSKTYCVLGEDAARMFYHPGRFTRRGALPALTLRLLQDEESVHQLDDEAHRWRKQLFFAVLAPGSMSEIVSCFEREWYRQLGVWVLHRRLILLDAMHELLCRTMCNWLGIPLSDAEASSRTREFAAMIDGAGAVGPRNWRAQFLRQRSERWGRSLIESVRARKLDCANGRPLEWIASYTDADGRLLDARTAAVELLNFIRPTVAVARYMVFAALALHEHPLARQRILNGDLDYLNWFVQEVRRHSPFFPLVGGRVRSEFDWRDHRFRQGDFVLLDLYGTNRDARLWHEPERFFPERFRDWQGDPDTLIPQGGGRYENGHRCPGEPLTIQLLRRAVTLLVTAQRYRVPQQDLRVDLGRIPTHPASGFQIDEIVPTRP